MFDKFTPASETEDEEPPETARKRTVTTKIIDVSRGISLEDKDVFVNDDPENFMVPLTIRRHYEPEFTNFSNLRNTGHKEFEMFPDLNPDYSS